MPYLTYEEYIDLKNLLVSTENFKYQDISQNFDLNKKYDLVQCLEVAEHLAEKDSDTLVNNIVKHGDIVLFSAAVSPFVFTSCQG